MPLYQCQPPTGYKDTADAWVNTGALVSRMNFALRLSSNQVPRTVVSLQSTVSSLQSSVTSRQSSVIGPGSQSDLDADAAIARFLSGNASDATRATIAKATTAPQMAALTLGSPEFQRR